MLPGSVTCFLLLLASLPAPAAEPVAGPVTGRSSEVSALSSLGSSIRSLTRRVSPAVVEIMVTGYGAATEEDGQTANRISRQRSSGSGVIVDPSGYIVTNAHVVRGAVSIKVLVGGPDFSTPLKRQQSAGAVDARVLGIDRQSDLALLKIDGTAFPSVRFGNSDKLSQGDIVLAIGSPMQLRNSLTMGVVSAPARAVDEDDPILYIQTDASINPGDSGGALVNADGRLIGINTSIMSHSGGNEGIGFAIPSNIVRSVYRQLRKNGVVSMGSLGVFVQNISVPLASGLDLPLTQGVVVSDVEEPGPGNRAGLKRRDIVLSLDGTAIRTARQFDNAIYQRQPGQKVVLVVRRGARQLVFSAEVAGHTGKLDPLGSLLSPAENLIPRLGIFCIEIDAKVAQLIPDLRRQYGLLVAAKSPEGQAQFIDLQPGDVIHAVNNLPVALLDLFRSRIAELKPGEPVALQIERDGRFRYVAFEVD